MTKHRAITLAGLVLALAILSPASALADPGCPASAPVGARGHLSAAPDQRHGNGQAQHSDAAVHGRGDGYRHPHRKRARPLLTTGRPGLIGFTPPNLVRLAAEADVTVVAANGDELYGHTTFTTEDFVLGSAHQDEGQITITGGSGRFEGAHGELDTTLDVSPGTFVQQDGVTWMTSQTKVTLAGYVIY